MIGGESAESGVGTDIGTSIGGVRPSAPSWIPGAGSYLAGVGGMYSINEEWSAVGDTPFANFSAPFGGPGPGPLVINGPSGPKLVPSQPGDLGDLFRVGTFFLALMTFIFIVMKR